MMQGGTIHAIARTAHHVRIMSGPLRCLQNAGHTVRLAHFPDNPGAAAARDQIVEDGFDPVHAPDVLARTKSGDTVVFAVRGGFDGPLEIDRLAERGVRFAQVCEGARFTRRTKYHPTLPIPVLAWGASAENIDVADVRIVGAPALERLGAPTGARGIALINYKFTYKEKALDPDGAWAQDAIWAARNAGFDPIVSAHPSADPPAGVEITGGASATLLPKAEILISRASTVVYEALMMGVQPFYLSVEGDMMKEFRWPRRSFPICADRDDLLRAIRRWKARKTVFKPERFLERHISRDPQRPAAERMAAEIAAIHSGPALPTR